MNKFVSVLLFAVMVCLVSCGGGDDTYYTYDAAPALKVTNKSSSITTKVFLDGKLLGKLAPLTSMTWEVSAGVHNVRFEKDSDSSASMNAGDYTFEVGYEQPLEIWWTEDLKST